MAVNLGPYLQTSEQSQLPTTPTERIWFDVQLTGDTVVYRWECDQAMFSDGFFIMTNANKWTGNPAIPLPMVALPAHVIDWVIRV